MNKDIVSEVIEKMGLGDFSKATIRDLQSLSRSIEEQTGERVIHLEMGVPGLQPSEIALKAEQEALANGCATQYPPNGGIINYGYINYNPKDVEEEYNYTCDMLARIQNELNKVNITIKFDIPD